MPTDNRTSELVINKLTKQQYENIHTPSDTEIYLVPEDEEHKPICYPTTASEVTTTSMLVKSSVSDNGKILTENGFVYNTSGNPTVSDTKVICDLGVGFMKKKLENLTQNTEYHIKSYGQNGSGIVYGSEMIQRTLDLPSYFYLHLMSTNVIADENNKISQWIDNGVNNYSIVQTIDNNKPLLENTIINGYPVVSFNGVNSYLNGYNILNLGTDDWDIFWVGIITSGSPQNIITKSKTGQIVGRYAIRGNSLIYQSADNTVNTLYYSLPINTPIIYNLKSSWSLGINTIFCNNNLITQGGIINKTAMTCNNVDFRIGAGEYSTESAFFNGKIAEIIFVNNFNYSNLIIDYLSNKYNIAIN